MATLVDLNIDQGSDITFSFQAFDVNGNPFSLAGAVINLTGKVAETAPASAIELSTITGEITITDPDNGIWTVWFPSTMTAGIPALPYVYNQLATIGSLNYRLSQGTVYLDQQVVITN